MDTHTLILGNHPGFAAVSSGLASSVLATFPSIPTIYLDDASGDVWTYSVSLATWSKMQRGEDAKVPPSTTIFVDCNRSDSYTPDGTLPRPFKSLSDALSAISKASAIVMAPGAYSEPGGAFPAFPVVIHGNGSSVSFDGAVTVSKDYTAYDLNVTCAAGITYAGSAGTERFMLRGGSRRGPLVVSKGLLDLQSCTQLWSVTGDKLQVTASGMLIEIGCINTLPVEQSGASSVVYVENCNWNTNRAGVYLLKTTAGQFSVANSVVVNGGAGGGGINVANTADVSAPNAISNTIVGAALSVTITSGVTLYSKVSASGAVSLGSTVIGVPDLKMYTTEPFVPVSTAFTVSASTPDNLILTANVAVNLGTALLAKILRIASTAGHQLVIPSGVSLYYNGTPYTGVTKSVPAGYCLDFKQISANLWMCAGTATLA